MQTCEDFENLITMYRLVSNGFRFYFSFRNIDYHNIIKKLSNSITQLSDTTYNNIKFLQK